MTLNSIEHEWQGFARMVFAGTSPSDVQVAEMKKAFFAGAWALFTALEEIGEPHVSLEEGEAFLTSRREECLAFKKKLLDEYSECN